MKQSILLVITVIIIVSCNSDKKPPFQLPENYTKIIAGDSAKTWKLARRYNNKTRMNMGDCFLSYRATYLDHGIMYDNNGEHEDCGGTLTANWSIYHSKDNYPYIKLKGEKLKALMNLDNDYKFFKILNLNDTLMILEFKHKQFSSKETTLVDIFVSENIAIKDRAFHW